MENLTKDKNKLHILDLLRSPCGNIIPVKNCLNLIVGLYSNKKVQVGKDQEKAQSEKDFHSKNRGGKKTN